MKKQTTLSFEVFPPKTEAGLTKLHGVLGDLYKWNPDWISCTYGAGITMPVAVGAMPVLDRDKCIRHCVSINGCAIPRSLARHISKYYDDPEGFRDGRCMNTSSLA